MANRDFLHEHFAPKTNIKMGLNIHNVKIVFVLRGHKFYSSNMNLWVRLCIWYVSLLLSKRNPLRATLVLRKQVEKSSVHSTQIFSLTICPFKVLSLRQKLSHAGERLKQNKTCPLTVSWQGRLSVSRPRCIAWSLHDQQVVCTGVGGCLSKTTKWEQQQYTHTHKQRWWKRQQWEGNSRWPLLSCLH